MVRGHHLYTNGTRFHVPGSHHGLVQPVRTVGALEEAFRKGKPAVFNTDQGSQFTGKAFTGLLEQHGIKISMDGRGSYRDNLFIERLWRTVKYEEVYLKAYQNGKDARMEIGDYFRFYNTARPHQALGYRTPAEVFTSVSFEETVKSVIESVSLGPNNIAGHYLNLAPLLS
jgi:putative transposase